MSKSRINLDLSKYDSEFMSDALDRVESGACVIRDKARVNLKRSITAAGGEYWREHGPYKTGKNAGQAWTQRYHGEMVNTIRATRSKNPFARNIFVMAGQYLAWWAVQLEYGNGNWKGGPKPFMRPALKESMGEVIAICESGGGPKAVK